MPFADDSRAELRRSPLTIIITALGVIIAAAALVVSWWSRPAAHPALAGSRAASIASASSVSLPNLAAVVAFLLASSLAGASLLRLLARRHPLPATILSIPIASSAAFGGVLVFQLAPPRPLTAAVMEAAGQTAFWTTLIVFAAVNGLPFAAGFMAPLRKIEPGAPDAEGASDTQDSLESFGGLAFASLIWGGLMGQGQELLWRTFGS